MADKTIGELAAATTLSASDIFPLDDGVTTRKASLEQLTDYVKPFLGSDFPEPFVVTLSIASPCVATKIAHGLPASGLGVFTTTGALPQGSTSGHKLRQGQLVQFTRINADTFSFSVNQIGGSPVTYNSTGGSQSGTHKFCPLTTSGANPVPYGFGIGPVGNTVIAASSTTLIGILNVNAPAGKPVEIVANLGFVESGGTGNIKFYLVDGATGDVIGIPVSVDKAASRSPANFTWLDLRNLGQPSSPASYILYAVNSGATDNLLTSTLDESIGGFIYAKVLF